jgi:hypothetical protein
MNNTSNDDNMLITTSTIVIGTFMLFFMCFALKMCFLNSYVLNTPNELVPVELVPLEPTCQDISLPPVYLQDNTPPSYQDSPPLYNQDSPPLYNELSNCTQTLALAPHLQVQPEHLD